MTTSLTDIIAYLDRFGIRPSAQRIAIMGYLMDNRVHPSVDDIYNGLLAENPTLSRTTVYNTLWLFAEAGAVEVLTIDRNNTRFDYSEYPHAHFLCDGCGRIFDVPADRSAVIAGDGCRKFHVRQMSLYYRGLCDSCHAACDDA